MHELPQPAGGSSSGSELLPEGTSGAHRCRKTREGCSLLRQCRIIAAPDAAPVIRGTGGIRKLRWAGSGRGKRGGIRAIYYRLAARGAIYMLAAYAKADRDDLSATDRKTLARLVAAIESEGQGE